MAWKEVEAGLLEQIETAMAEDINPWTTIDFRNMVIAAAIAHEKAKDEKGA